MDKYGIGQSLSRFEDPRLLRGAGRFVNDVSLPRQAYATFLRSPHAHAAIRAIDTTAAKAAPGVLGVFTEADVAAEKLGTTRLALPRKRADGSPAFARPHPGLARGSVRYVGDPVAMVVAETLAEAKDAAELIEVDYAPLPAIATIEDALKPGAARVWDENPDNVSHIFETGNKAAADAAFGGAAHVVKGRYAITRVHAQYMEPRGTVGAYDAHDERFTLHADVQYAHRVRDMLAANVFKIPETQIRVVTGDVGGGFGTKTFCYREYPLAAEAAKRLKRPVRWIADRSDHFMGDAQGRDNFAVGEVAMDKSGRFLAMRFDILGNIGAYASQFGPYIPFLGGTMMTGVYRTPALHVRVRGVYTNTVPVDAYRGAGRPEAAYLLERLVDRAARETGLKPEQIRRRNFISPKAMPYTTPIGDRTYDTGDFDQHMTRAIEAADWAGFKDRQRAARKEGKIRGIGMATYIECTAWGEGEDVEIRLETDGTVTVYSGTQSNGQGHATAYAQFAAQHLDLPLERIKVVQGDTQQVKTGHGTGGSRSIPVGGVSVYVASEKLAEKLKELASQKLEASVADLEVADGGVKVVGTDRRIDFAELANLPEATREARTGEGDFTPPNATYPNGTHIAEVEIDVDTGVAQVVRYTICDDFGIAVNPMLLAGQVHGGVVQGIGQALLERTVFDEDGQLVTASFMDYCLPRAGDVPFLHFETRNVPSTTNPLGMKGAGEAGSIGSCPAVMNAVVDALDRAFGIRDIDMPATPDRVFAAISRAGKAAA
jgi:aerobic carbon-monoxide dehydrogenase large subunit